MLPSCDLGPFELHEALGGDKLGQLLVIAVLPLSHEQEVRGRLDEDMPLLGPPSGMEGVSQA
jgi:hypothetical protein